MAEINWTNVTDLGQLPSQANVASGDTFWQAMFYMVWIIFLMFFIGWGFEVAIIVSSFIILIPGLLLVYAGLMAWQNLLSVVGVLLFMFLYVIYSTSKLK